MVLSHTAMFVQFVVLFRLLGWLLSCPAQVEQDRDQPRQLSSFAYMDCRLVDDLGCYAEAEAELNRVRRFYEKPGHEESRVAILGTLAYYCLKQGKFAEAELLYNEALAMCGKYPRTKDAADQSQLLSGLSACCLKRGDVVSAERLAVDALSKKKDSKASVGEVVDGQVCLARAYVYERRFADAEVLLQSALATANKEKLGPDRTASILETYAKAAGELAGRASSEELRRQALQLRLKAAKERLAKLEDENVEVERNVKNLSRQLEHHPEAALEGGAHALADAELNRAVINYRLLVCTLRNYAALLRENGQEVEAARQEVKLQNLKQRARN